ncbi:Zn-ribbon domain-containing OB-fold protein [Bordetella bronchiseptica]|uniref:Zn-ribbon domain-containing OB-fold protein n=2 Tax=Bordetella bronchiseptica TaxID=518 RepID=A0A0H3LX15_BORBR|nr:OB-fold domain-containing protein [Bordetella bronchiseptica]KAK61052.1 PF01796 domain protein [Bordetella bronchiseptica 980-2]KDC66911.1 PF01796 domain protein [Bordetella bronchiseptica MBORD624]KDD57926.1 PF01796 domain protein [Bordetella bronchiseptica OSU553]AMG90316.1 hypothetical protein AL472_23205 [Bordetella bronchiseptica]AWP86473.1 hypothetical protein B7P00_21080 [Bordetella bronchiseptica]
MMMSDYSKPLPELNDLNRPFWAAARQGRLSLQHCASCGHVQYPINPVCTTCLDDRLEWRDVSGKGEIFSYIVYHKAYTPAYADELPYNVAMIQLAEGPRLISNVRHAQGATPKVGDPVQVVFDQVTDDIAIPRFEVLA